LKKKTICLKTIYILFIVILRISNLPVPDYYASIDYSDVADFLNDNFKGLEVCATLVPLILLRILACSITTDAFYVCTCSTEAIYADYNR